MSDPSKMSFLEHLEELRKRLIICIVAMLAGMIVCWFLREEILSFLLSPLYKAWSQVEGLPEPKPLNFSNMLEPFVAYLKLSAIGGLFLAAPVVLYQLWKFIAPGLYAKERRLAAPFVIVSSLLFVGGSILAYAIVFPIGFRFFLEFAAGRESSAVESITVVPSYFGANESRAVGDGGATEPDDSTAKGGSAKAAPPVDTVPETMDEWGAYKWLASLFSGKGCASLDSKLMPEVESVLLTLEWSLAVCGDPPHLSGFKRDGMTIAAEWAEDSSQKQGFQIFTARDEHPPPGERRYELTVPSEPSNRRLIPILMVKDYLSFAIQLLLAFGVIFELPVLISFLSFAGIVNYRQLLKFSRWFIVIAVFVGAMLTPPDVVTQILLAMPLVILYFVSVLVAYMFGPKVES